MPFPPPPAPAPRVSAARPPPRRPRKTAAPTCAPPAPLPPAATREKQRPPARPEALLSRSWPSATLRKPPVGRAPGPAPRRAQAPAGSSPSPAGTTDTAALGPRREAAARFPLNLPPEVTPVLHRRPLEQQLLARPRRLLPAPLASATLPLGPQPGAKGRGPRRGGGPGGLDARLPGLPLPPRGRWAPDPSPRPAHLRGVLKVSLLNDRHKYDDVEYEEEATVMDEDLVRRCTEWLRGVEAAAAARSRTGPLDLLPHLSTL
ncbi:proline-rich protein 18 [Phyllostomus discolor]|uniref:Proline-rich protein 18 n=1 Tax=Phyllostomus discolor TaxID=89673 RepID=A0A6J2KX51_9CHIR|nr:proline-rich protein 18 [Phyllostomus discolor]